MITHKKVVMINIKIFSLLVRHHCDHVDAGETWKKENHGNRILFNFSLLLSSIYLFWKVRVKFLNCFYKVMSPFSWKEMFKMITSLSMAPCFLYWSGKVIAEFEMPLSWYDYPIHTEFTSKACPFLTSTVNLYLKDIKSTWQSLERIYPKCVCSKEVTKAAEWCTVWNFKERWIKLTNTE